MSGSPPRTHRPAAQPAAGAVRPGPPPARRPGPAGPPRMGWKAVFFGLMAIAIVAAVAWALLGSRFLIVRSVRVTGVGPAVSRAQVIAAAQIPTGLPLIRVNTSAVAHRVGGIRQVQSAQVSRDWPHTIVISVSLRTPVFAVAVPGGYALVDAFGVDLRNSARRPPGFPLLQLTAGAAAGSRARRGGCRDAAARQPGGPCRRRGSARAAARDRPAGPGGPCSHRVRRVRAAPWRGGDRLGGHVAACGKGGRTGPADAHARPQLRRQRTGYRRHPGLGHVLVTGDRPAPSPAFMIMISGVRGAVRPSFDHGQNPGSRNTGEVRAWRVDPAPGQPYCPYQSPA